MDFIVLKFCRSEVQNDSFRDKVKVLAGLVPSGSSKGESILYLFQLLEVAGISWLTVTSLQSLQSLILLLEYLL